MTVTSVLKAPWAAGTSRPACTVVVPVQGPGSVGVKLENPNATLRPGQQSAGRAITSGAESEPRRPDHPDHAPRGRQRLRGGLQVPRAAGRPSFVDSELHITFSADGTTLWASDNDGIWQFKTTASLADSTTGTLIGLNDLRTLGVPYDGQGSAVAVVDTGVDGQSPPFRGRVTTGTNIWTGGPGNQDLAASAGGGTTGAAGGTGTTGTTGTAGTSSSGQTLANTFDGHGTPVAGVVAQFVPQATIEPVTIFSPFVGWFAHVESRVQPARTGAHRHHRHHLLPERHVQCPDHQPSGLQRLEVRCEPPLRERPGTSRQGRPRDRIEPRLRYNRDLHQRIHSLQAVSPDRYRAQEPVAQAPQAGHRSDRGVWPVWRSAGGYEQHEYHGHRQHGTTGTTGTTGSSSGIVAPGFNSADNASLGDVNGMSLPAVLNEVISVTGTYPFPFTTSPSTIPTDPPVGVIPNPLGPVLVFGNALTIGGTASTSTTGTTGTTGTRAPPRATLPVSRPTSSRTPRLTP